MNRGTLLVRQSNTTEWLTYTHTWLHPCYIYWVRHSASGAQESVFLKPSMWFHCSQKFENHSSKQHSSRSEVGICMATHSSTLAWKIPRMEEPGRLQSIGLRRVRHDWATSLSLFTFMHWRRKWHSSVLAWRIPGTGEPGWAAVYGVTESKTTEATWQWHS